MSDTPTGPRRRTQDDHGKTERRLSRKPRTEEKPNGSLHRGLVAKGLDDEDVREGKEEKDVKPAQDQEEDEESDDDVLERTRLDISSHPLPPTSDLILALSKLPNLQRLDMSAMQASADDSNPNGLERLDWLGEAALKSKSKAKRKQGLSGFGDRLTWLKFSENPSLGQRAGSEAWDGLEHLSNLSVLNASSCALPVSPPTSALMAWTSLGALILGHNNISVLAHFPAMPLLNTLVLSHNKIEKLPKDLPASVPSLKKLSMTHNVLCWDGEGEASSPLPDFSLCSHLREVRISGNSALQRLPKHLSTWGKGVGNDRKGTGLEIFEAGDCGFANFDAITALLQDPAQEEVSQTAGIHPSRRRLRGLTTLLLRGNGVTQMSGYKARMMKAHPGLRTLDSEKTGVALSQKPVQEQTGEEGKERKTVVARSESKGKEGLEKSTNRGKAVETSRISAEEKGGRHRAPAPAGRRELSKGPQEANEQRVQARRKEEGKKQLKPRMAQKAPVEEERKKPRKRGARGGKSKSATVEEGGKGVREDLGSSGLQNDPFLVSSASVERNGRDDPRLARMQARAGAPPSSDGDDRKDRVDRKAKASKDARPNKRKAWDTEAEPATKKAKPSETTAKKDHAGAASTANKEASSVAGVVQVVKKPSSGPKRSAGAEVAPKKAPIAWGQRNDLALGTGGAWD